MSGPQQPPNQPTPNQPTPNQPTPNQPPAFQPTPYQPPEPPGARTRTTPTVLIVSLLVLAVGVLVVVAGLLFFRVLAASDDDAPTARPSATPTSTPAANPTAPAGPVELAEQLQLQLVVSATPGACPDGSDGYPLAEPAECLQLGDGFAVRELRSVSTALSNTQPVVRMRFMPADREALADLTRKALGERMALVYADEVIMAALVNGPIEGGELEIAGNYTAAEAEQLAARLRGE